MVFGAGLIGFAGMFAFGWLTTKNAPLAVADANHSADSNHHELKLADPQLAMVRIR